MNVVLLAPTDGAAPLPGNTQCKYLPSNVATRFNFGETSQPLLATAAPA